MFLLGSLACSTSQESSTYKIAFVPSRSGQHGIFVMRSDGTGGKLLTDDPNARLRPESWSPDGKRIAFLTFRSADSDLLTKPRVPTEYPLYVMDAGGMNPRRLVDYPVSDFGWSPDSRRVFTVSAYENPEAKDPAVQSGKKNPASAIYIVSSQGGDSQRVTALGNNCFASWSPDGTRLALSSGTETEANIFVVDIERRRARQLTDSPNLKIHPVWSADGRTIAYVSLPSSGSTEKEVGVFLVDADGSQNRQLSELVCFEAAWSPDSKQLMLQSSSGIYLVSVSGGKPLRLSVGSDRPLDATFTPDGKGILYRSNDEGEWQIYEFDFSGGARKRITSRMSAGSYCLSPLLSSK